METRESTEKPAGSSISTCTSSRSWSFNVLVTSNYNQGKACHHSPPSPLPSLTWKTICFKKVCLTHLTMYSVSLSVSSIGFSEDLKRGPSLEKSAMAESCSRDKATDKQGSPTWTLNPPAYTSCLDATGFDFCELAPEEVGSPTAVGKETHTKYTHVGRARNEKEMVNIELGIVYE